jgi:hypothetical protein
MGDAVTWSTWDMGERGLTDGSHGIVALRGQTSLNLIQNLSDSNRFKFFQTLANPKGAFSKSKFLNKIWFEGFE